MYFFAFLYSQGVTSSQTVEQQTVLAVLTFNIARFSQWPDSAFINKPLTLNLCVIGNNVVQQSFEKINNKVTNHKTVHVINLSRLRNLDQCHLLYISELKRNKLISLRTQLKELPVLTIGENMEFLQLGGMVGLLQVNGKIQLSINLAIIKQSGLLISSRLLKLAKIVDYPFPVQ